MEQLPLFGNLAPALPRARLFRPRPTEATDRYFFAVSVPLEVRPRIAALTDDLAFAHALPSPPLSPENLHITLFHLGDFTLQQPELVAVWRKFGSTVHARPFGVTFDQAESWPRQGRKSPLVLLSDAESNGLIDLHDRFRMPLVERGIVTPAARKFIPHVTLMHDYTTVPKQDVAPIGWRVEEFLLIHSLLGQGRHIPLGKWRLRG